MAKAALTLQLQKPKLCILNIDQNVVTQWFSQDHVTIAGPKDRAGFILAPVKGIWGDSHNQAMNLTDETTSLS